MKNKSRRFDIPHLENELKKSRDLCNLTTKKTQDKDEKISNIVDQSHFNGSCISDADEWHICHANEYSRYGIKYNNGVTLVRAKYSKRATGEYYQLYSELFHIEEGTVKFKMNGVEMELVAGSKLDIPSRSWYVREFITETEAIVGVPTDIIGNS